MARRLGLCIAGIVLCLSLVPKGQSRPIKAFVGGTLIDGNASRRVDIVIKHGTRYK